MVGKNLIDRCQLKVTARITILGTPAYMLPEQANGNVDEIDAQSDVFGLGAILCVLLIGRPPYVLEDGDTPHNLAARGNLQTLYCKLDECSVDREVIALCKRCLSTEKRLRPLNAGEVAQALANIRAAAESVLAKRSFNSKSLRLGPSRNACDVVLSLVHCYSLD